MLGGFTADPMLDETSQASMDNNFTFSRGGRLQWFSLVVVHHVGCAILSACTGACCMGAWCCANKGLARVVARAEQTERREQMLSSLGGAGLRIAGWSLLPDFVTKQLITFYHRFLRARGAAPPKPNSIDYAKTYRIFYAFTILTYLVYNFIDAARSTPPNFFEILGLGPKADDTSIRSAYRVFAKRYHPDRAGPDSEAMFMAVRDAYEALKDPVKRFAYERFGQDSLHWKHCYEPRDYVWHGIIKASDFYIVSIAILIAMSIFMKRSRVSFWRYMLLLGLLACELYFVAGPSSYGFLELLFPHRVAFQHVSFFHQIFVFMSVAISRVIPVLFPSSPALDDPAQMRMVIAMLQKLTAQANGEVTQLMHSQLLASGCVTGDDSSNSDLTVLRSSEQQKKELLLEEMENILVERRIRVEPPLQPLWDAAVRRRRDASAAAALQVDLNESQPSQSMLTPEPKHPEAPSMLSPDKSSSRFPLNDDGDVSADNDSQSSASTETMLAVEGLRQRSSSTKPYIRVVASSTSHPSRLDDDVT